MKRTMDLLALQDFVLVARHGGISAAGRASGRSKATLSRQLARLEDELQVRLVERGANQLRLTAEGTALHARAAELLFEVGELKEEIQGKGGQPEGPLRLSAPMLFSHVHLGSIAAAFLARYPKVVLDASVEDRHVDLVSEGYDVVVRVNPPPAHGLVGRCFLRDGLALVASPGVTARWNNHEATGIPAIELSSSEEKKYWCVHQNAEPLRIAKQVVLKLPNYTMIRTATLDSAGAAAIPYSIVDQDVRSGELVNWGTIDGPQTQLWVLHTARRLTSPKVRAFVDFLVDWFSEANASSIPGAATMKSGRTQADDSRDQHRQSRAGGVRFRDGDD